MKAQAAERVAAQLAEADVAELSRAPRWSEVLGPAQRECPAKELVLPSVPYG